MQAKDHRPVGLCLAAMLSLLSLLSLLSAVAEAESLSLAEAERLALAHDPGVEAIESRQAALGELQVAAMQLPDPMLKMGVMSLPTNSFQLGQEEMTELQVGLVQRFPRGDSRRLRGEQLREQAAALGEAARDLELQVRLAVREEFLEVLKQQRLAELNRSAEATLQDLEELTLDYFTTGRAQQQDVLRATVELSRVRERANLISENEERARARLGIWVDQAAWQSLEPDWPELAQPAPAEAIIQALDRHPRLLALHQQVMAADQGVALAEQAYKPEFSVDLTYGDRDGLEMDGSDRTDLLSFMVMMDLPLFTARRQDRLAEASIAESRAAAFDRDDAHRRMRAEVTAQDRTLDRQRERLTLFETALLPAAEFNAEASFSAYQAAAEDLSTLMRARITEIDLQLDRERLQAELLKTRARLLYLQGASS